MGDKRIKGKNVRIPILIGVVIALIVISTGAAYAERVVKDSQINKDTNQASVGTDAISTININSGTTPTTLVNNLLGGGITVSNVQFTGANVAAGTFTGGTGIIGFNNGIILSTGDIKNVIGPNTQDSITTNNAMPGDVDLDNVLDSVTTLDAAVLEFDFVPTTNKLTFKYVFSSDEYNEFVGQFNDVFGFFVNGVNVALIPGTNTPVSINNVNCGNPYDCIYGNNPSYYRNNDLQDGGGSINTEMDGLTTVLTVTANVNAGQTNHIKLAIADAIDRLYDSNVFIEAGSFASSQLKLDPPTATNNIGTSHTLTAKLVDGNLAPIYNKVITFTVTAGPHIGTTGTSTTNDIGIATWSYTGTNVGTDTIVATGFGQTSNSVKKIWAQASLPTLSLTPATATNDIGMPHKLTATLLDGAKKPILGQDIVFTVTTGPNAGKNGVVSTNSAGIATWSYTGIVAGKDTIVATGYGLTSIAVSKTWVKPVLSTITLTPATATNDLGTPHKLTAKLVDGTGKAISGQVITFTVTAGPHKGSLGTGTTSSTGVATFSYTGTVAGTDSIQASAVVSNVEIFSNTVKKIWKIPVGDILAYYRGLGMYPNIVETTDLLKAADDWRDSIVPPGFYVSLTTSQLLTLADEWRTS